MKTLIFFIITISSSLALASPSQETYLQQFFAEFEKSPQRAMSQTPPKFDSNGEQVFEDSSFFTIDQIQSLNFVDIKITQRPQVMSKQPLAGITPSNDWRRFFSRSTQVLTDVRDLTGPLQNKSVEVSPWSGDYWPTYRGGIGARYSDASYPQTRRADDYIRYYERNKNINLNNRDVVDDLSPAEKYDILVGDENFGLTRWTWSEIKHTLDSQGSIPTWFGLCHGWAPASYMMPRPLKAVDVAIKNFKGVSFTLRLYPDDLKALISLLWANAQTPTHFIGGRCDSKGSRTDSNGRIINEECFDVNPGAWHLTMINQVGVSKRSFIMDATWDAEVWNQPIKSYKVLYFNPQSRRTASNIESAIIDINDYNRDPFRKYRSPQTRSVVGVNMEVEYVIETAASHAQVDSPQSDITRRVQYIYDLELDSQGQVIGGEWFQNAHPDFLWTPTANSRASSFVDHLLTTPWDGEASVPLEWRPYAPQASRNGQPMAKVIEVLLQRAR
ncbi:MAG: hypothetical protein BroJett040_11880 [Oligoflexia bacterium]|nr:MAG: hypothetical protein BroJett040_11880 [Oligoflexia bacterium]